MYSLAAELSEEAIAAARRSLDSAFSSAAEADKQGRSVVDTGDDSDSDDDDDDDDEEQGAAKDQALIGGISLSRLFSFVDLQLAFLLFIVNSSKFKHKCTLNDRPFQSR